MFSALWLVDSLMDRIRLPAWLKESAALGEELVVALVFRVGEFAERGDLPGVRVFLLGFRTVEGRHRTAGAGGGGRHGLSQAALGVGVAQQGLGALRLFLNPGFDRRHFLLDLFCLVACFAAQNTLFGQLSPKGGFL